MIHLINGYYLVADKYGYTVGKPKEKKDSKGTMWLSPKYYPTIEQAVASTAERVIRESVANEEVATLNEAVAKMQDIKDELTNVLNEFKKYDIEVR